MRKGARIATIRGTGADRARRERTLRADEREAVIRRSDPPAARITCTSPEVVRRAAVDG